MSAYLLVVCVCVLFGTAVVFGGAEVDSKLQLKHNKIWELWAWGVGMGTLGLLVAIEGKAKYVDVCYRNDPKVAECIKSAIEKLLPIFKPGSDDFELESLDPMFLANLTFSFKSALLGGKIVIPGSKVSGLSNLKVTDVRLHVEDPAKFLLDFDAFVPKMNIENVYKLSGNVFTFPVGISGHMDIDFVDVNLTYHLSGDVKPVDGVDFLDLTSFRWRLRGDGMRHMRLLNDDVVHDSPFLNRLVVSVLKTSWKLLKNQVVPTLLPETDKIMTAMFTKFFKKYPYDVIFPKEKLS